MDDQKRMILAVAISATILFGWQYLNRSQAPTQNTQNLSNEKTYGQGTGDHEGTISNKAPSTQPSLSQKSKGSESEASENIQFFQETVSSYQLALNSRGELTDFSSSELDHFLKLQEVTGVTTPFVFFVSEADKESWKRTKLELVEKTEGSLVFQDLALGLNLTLSEAENGALSFLLNFERPKKVRFQLLSTKYDPKNTPTVEERYNLHREFVISQKSAVDRYEVDEGISFQNQNLRWVGVDFSYHLFGISFPQNPKMRYGQVNEGQLIVQTTNAKNQIQWEGLFLKKSYDRLSQFGNGLSGSVDFGIFGVIAVPILRGLQFVYRFIPNYGVAIIFITLLMRFLVFPLHMKSFRSMKKMQDLKPQMDKIRERHKDDPQKMQKETVALFKKTGANPLGGCLPLLAQMPVFFAFYQVLYNAVELVDAPFALWIHDLSSKDPYYILPLFMCVAMLIQQKMMPTNTSMDPTQRKMMLFMPLVFGLIMKDLPSGLTLYILVSTLFGIVQQLYVYKKTQS